MTRRLLMAFCGAAFLASGMVAVAATQSDTQMADRYSKAAEAGDDQAQFYLGALYASGTGLAQSDRNAAKWISRAAEQGHSQAMLVYAAMLAIGRGMQKDDVAAYKWAYIVAQGSRVYEFKNGAQQLMTLLETRITPGQVTQAKTDADRFRQSKTQSPGTPNPSPAIEKPSSPPPAPAKSPEASISPSKPASDPPSPSVTSKETRPTSTPDSRDSRESRDSKDSRDSRDRDRDRDNRDSSPSARANSLPKKDRNDMDKMLDMVPSNMRKQYGF